MNAPNLFTDISRGRENSISKEMNLVVNKTKDIESVLSLIDGIRSTFEIANLLNKPIHKISGRFTELKKFGKIQQKGSIKIENSKYSVYEKI